MKVIGYKLPYFLSKRLFGDRRKYGLEAKPGDPDLIEFEKLAWDFYNSTQQTGFAAKVNGMGYQVVSKIDFQGKKVLEVGPGVIHHLDFMKTYPEEYCLCDIRDSVLEVASRQLKERSIPFKRIKLNKSRLPNLPFSDDSYDIILSFYSLEHLFPLEQYMVEIARVLKSGGMLVGAVPCEGGLGWGLGRFLTTRRFVINNYGINYDKLICWHHPNFVNQIFSAMDKMFHAQSIKLHPFSFLPADLNLVASFIYQK